jgi:ankyrin repeat protein
MVKVIKNGNGESKKCLCPTELYCAIFHKDFELVKTILKTEDINYYQDTFVNNDTYLHIACLTSTFNIVQILINNGADKVINIPNDFYDTPIFYASKNNDSRILRLLIEKGAEVNLTNKWNSTPLYTASANNIEENCDILINHTKDLNFKTNFNDTVLISATRNNLKNIVKRLIMKGANIKIKNNLNESAFDIASKNNFKEILNIFY